MEFLAGKGVHMERPNHNGATPLFYAATNGHLDVVKLLLERGVCADTADAEGTTPFHVACRRGDVALAETLADHGVDIDKLASDGQSALEVAVAHERKSVVAWLSRIQSVPATTPKLVAALQRRAWAMLSITPQSGGLLSYDLLELTGKTVPNRVSWQFAMSIVGSPVERSFKPTTMQRLAPPIQNEAYTDAREGVDAVAQRAPPVVPISRPFPGHPAVRGGATGEDVGATRSLQEGARADEAPGLLRAAGMDGGAARETERTERSSTA